MEDTLNTYNNEPRTPVMVDEKKVAIPVEVLAVYEFKDSNIVGGAASHIVEKVISSLEQCIYQMAYA